jgi:hypothetical protein
VLSSVKALQTLPPQQAASLALEMGAAVERGTARPELSAPAVIDLMHSWLPQLPEREDLLKAFRDLAPSVVTHLARIPQLRATLSEDLPLLERLAELEEHTIGAAWIRETLLRSTGSLIVLHVSSGRGFRLHYRNVATCFHLFSLLQTAIGEQLPGGRKPDPLITAAARGKSPDDVKDEAWWHYGDPRSKVADLKASIWGEGLVREIPVIDGERIMLAWPPLLASRTWDSAFFGPQLDAVQPDVVIEAELSTADSSALFQKLGISQAKRKWWPW